MTSKLKILGLGFLATMAIGSFAVTSTTANTGGHIAFGANEGTFQIYENPNHRLEFSIAGFKSFICPESLYEGPYFASKTSAVYFTRANALKCMTKNGTPGELDIDFNGCGLEFKIGKKALSDNTTDIICKEGKPFEITHPNCTIKVPAQPGFAGVSYKHVMENGKHVLTLELTVGGEEAETYFESGICVFLGTSHGMVVTGGMTIKAFDKEKKQVSVTATGTEDK
jgi:hypothetical protein